MKFRLATFYASEVGTVFGFQRCLKSSRILLRDESPWARGLGRVEFGKIQETVAKRVRKSKLWTFKLRGLHNS